jgi:rhodanese-related sulfurtransferase
MSNFLSRLFRRSPATEAEWIDIDALQPRLDQVVLIDVRGPDEFNAAPGHLPGAINIPLSELPSRINEVSMHARPVILVCKTDRRSAKAAEILLTAGLREVAVLRGGTDGWHARGLPLD